MEKIKLTSINTIILGYKEFIFDDFIKKMNDNFGKDYSVFYYEEDKKFGVMFDGFMYELILDEIIIYNYGSFISILKQLDDRRVKIEQENAYIKSEKDRRDEIIKNAKNDIIPGDEARRVYLEYLKDELKPIFRLKKYFNNLRSDILSSRKNYTFFYENDIVNVLFMFIILTAIILAYFVICAAIVFLGNNGYLKFYCPINFKILNVMWGCLLPLYRFPLKFIAFSIETLLYRIFRFINCFNSYKRNEKKIIKYKIEVLSKQLERGIKEDKTLTNNSFDKTLYGLINENDMKFKTSILNKFYVIHKRIKNINSCDGRVVLLEELKQIALEYKKRIVDIKKQELDGNRLDINSYFSIEKDIVMRLRLLEKNMLEIRGRDVDEKVVGGRRIRAKCKK